MDVKLPDGTVIKDVPDGTSKADLVHKLQKNGMDVPKEWLSSTPPKESLPETTAAGAFGRGALRSAAPTAAGIAAFPAGAAAGAALGAMTGPAAPIAAPVLGLAGGIAASMGAGAVMNKVQDQITSLVPESLKERLGLGKSIEKADKEQHPLASMAGEIAPQAAFMRPGAISLGQAALGAGAGGGLEAGRQIASGEKLDISKMGIAAGAGAVLQKPTALGRKVGIPEVGRTEPTNLTPEQVLKNQNVKSATDAGYVIPPTQAAPTKINKLLEGFSGKLQTAQKASEKNQEVTNNLAKKSIGIPEDIPITNSALSDVRKDAGKAYSKISKLGTDFQTDSKFKNAISDLDKDVRAAMKEFPALVGNKEIETLQKSLNKQTISPEASIELIKHLRSDATANLKNFQDPAKVALGRAQKKASDAIEDMIDQNLTKSKNRQLLTDYRAARQKIAKAYTIEEALNETTGNVSAKKIGSALDKGKPLSGELKQIGEFSRAFPKAAQNVEQIGSQPGFSPLDVATGLIAGGATGNPLAGAAVAARPAVRAVILSKPFQKYAVSNGMPAAAKKFNVPLSAIITSERKKDEQQ